MIPSLEEILSVDSEQTALLAILLAGKDKPLLHTQTLLHKIANSPALPLLECSKEPVQTISLSDVSHSISAIELVRIHKSAKNDPLLANASVIHALTIDLIQGTRNSSLRDKEIDMLAIATRCDVSDIKYTLDLIKGA
jgi:hypothetical protein